MSFRDRRKNRADHQEEEIEMNETALDMLAIIAGTDKKPTKRVQQQANALVAAGIVPADDGTLVYKDFKLTRVGLLAPEQIQPEHWNELGNILRQMEASLQWLIGDWVNYGEFVYGYTYEQIATAMGYEEKTIREYAYVARSVELSIRMDKLSFGHHQAVAALPAEDQYHWLQQAAANGWSIAALRRKMGGEEVVDQSPPYVREYQTFESKYLKLAQKSNPDDRRWMADRMEELARRLRSM